MSERMNKYCAAFLLLLSGGGNAAQAQTAYSVSGRIEDPSMKGRKIYLSIYDHDGRDIDSATVHNQSFRMEGVADAPYFVRLEPSDRKSYANFVLEDSVVIDYQAHKPSSGGKLTHRVYRKGARTKRKSTFRFYKKWIRLDPPRTRGEKTIRRNIPMRPKHSTPKTFTRDISTSMKNGLGRKAPTEWANAFGGMPTSIFTIQDKWNSYGCSARRSALTLLP